jgi:two-component system KDP operon response regulator KdpE
MNGPSAASRGGARVLVIEDEPQLRFALRRYLEERGFSVREAADGPSGLSGFAAFRPDIVLLDLMLPGLGGVDVCREIRREHTTPIIVLSALGEEKTKVQALDEGADDYLTKPFGMDELTARIRVALRHQASAGAGQAVITAGDLTLDLERRRTTVDGRQVHLTPTEYNLLRYLASNAGKVLTHPMILRSVWGPEFVGDTAVLRTCVAQLRDKLGDAGALIKTEPRVGYRLVLPDEGA